MNPLNRMVESKKVCIVGAGAAGLVSARELKKEGHKLVVIEQKSEIGGQWAYEGNVEDVHPLGNNKIGIKQVHSSVYESVRLILSREIMGCTDFPFIVKKDRDMRRFPGPREFLLYLKDFCECFGLREMIRLNTRVEYVGMVNNCDEEIKWLVKTSGKDSDDILFEEVFDAVVVATGHYSQPRLPCIKGMDTWNGKQLHSHVYRIPDPFLNEVVVVVGCSVSGQDIAMDLVGIAKQIYLVARTLDVSDGLSKFISKHDTLHLFPEIDFLQEDGGVVFIDGSCISADTIIYCTGYLYSFPFLDTKGIITVDDGRVGPLYEHTFPPSLSPSLTFVGIPNKIIPLPFFEMQARWIAQVLAGKKGLPSYNEMMQSVTEFYHSRDIHGIPKHLTHYTGLDPTSILEYYNKYADLSGSSHMEGWRKELLISVLQNARKNIDTYRDSYDDHELIQLAYQSPYFTPFAEVYDSSFS